MLWCFCFHHIAKQTPHVSNLWGRFDTLPLPLSSPSLKPHQGEIRTTNPMFMGRDIDSDDSSASPQPIGATTVESALGVPAGALAAALASNNPLFAAGSVSSSSSVSGAAAAGARGAVRRGVLNSGGFVGSRLGGGSTSPPMADSPMGAAPPVSGDSADPGGDQLAVGKGAALPDVFASSGSTSAGGRGRPGTSAAAASALTGSPAVDSAVARGTYTELYGGLSSASPSVSPGVMKEESSPGSPAATAAVAEAEAEAGEAPSVDTLSDDAATSEPSGLEGGKLRPSTKLPTGTAPQHQQAVGDTHSRSPAAAAAAAGSGVGVAVAAGTEATTTPPATGSSGVAEVGSTAAAIATVTRSMERERQQQDAEVAPPSDQEVSIPEPRQGRRNSGGGISSLRNTWQGAF